MLGRTARWGRGRKCSGPDRCNTSPPDRFPRIRASATVASRAPFGFDSRRAHQKNQSSRRGHGGGHMSNTSQGRLDEVQRAVDRAGKALEEARTAWDVALEKLAMVQ